MTNTNSKQNIFICDIDGTLADHAGIRSPFDESKVHLDLPIIPVIEVVKALRQRYKVIFISGRTDACFSETHQWLDKHLREPGQEGPIAIELLMRQTGDQRRDAIIKKQIYETHIFPHYNILGAFDDRMQVCRMLYENEIFCFNVNQGLKEF